MRSDRRNFIRNVSFAGLSGVGLPHSILGNGSKKQNEYLKEKRRPGILFFDVNETLLDLTAMKKSVGKALGGRGELLPLWFTTMLQYSLVATVGRHYEDFAVIGAAALRMVASNNGIELTENQAKNAIQEPIQSLPPHPEVKEALKDLKAEGYKLVSFTNSSNKGVAAQFKNAGLIDLFDDRLSIEDIGKFKPHLDAYDWAARKMNLLPSECLMVAAHGWDIAGAAWAGWRTAFISRPGNQLYPLAPRPEMEESNLTAVAQKLIALKK